MSTDAGTGIGDKTSAGAGIAADGGGAPARDGGADAEVTGIQLLVEELFELEAKIVGGTLDLAAIEKKAQLTGGDQDAKYSAFGDAIEIAVPLFALDAGYDRTCLGRSYRRRLAVSRAL